MTCTATEVVPVPAGANNEAGPAQSAKYRQAVFYDFRSGRQQLIASAAECRQAVASFVPGRVLG
jgi:hypothetical protein